MHAQIPEKYATYGCEDYFQGDCPVDGYFDEASQTLVVVPLSEIYEITESSFLAVGRSGLGCIDFGYRKNLTGLWAFYPIDQEIKFMASGIQELVEGWCSGRLFI